MGNPDAAQVQLMRIQLMQEQHLPGYRSLHRVGQRVEETPLTELELYHHGLTIRANFPEMNIGSHNWTRRQIGARRVFITQTQAYNMAQLMRENARLTRYLNQTRGELNTVEGILV